MSITDPGTVLLLGAGTSAPFGLPLGAELINLIGDAIRNERSAIYKNDDYFSSSARQSYSYAASTEPGFLRFPVHGTLARSHQKQPRGEIDWGGIDRDAARLVQLSELLRDQTSETIDDFIVENPGFADLAKMGISALLMKGCYQETERDGYKSFKPRAFAARFFQNERNWVHLLINIVRHGVRKREVTAENKIQIITFNYDCILEYVLEEQFSKTEAKHPHWSNFIEILHVHGAFQPVTSDPNDLANLSLQSARGVHVVNESVVPDELRSTRERAVALIKDAPEIFAVGFSFAGPNCKLLGLDKLKPLAEGRKRFLRFCNYDGNVGVKRSAEDLAGRTVAKRIVVEEAPGSIDRPLGVANWLKSGHLGELPG